MFRRRAAVTGDEIERIAAGPVITVQAGSRPRPNALGRSLIGTTDRPIGGMSGRSEAGLQHA
jgi:hypothetical protein